MQIKMFYGKSWINCHCNNCLDTCCNQHGFDKSLTGKLISKVDGKQKVCPTKSLKNSINLFLWKKLQKTQDLSCNGFVASPIDKANKNVIFICQ